MSFEKKRYRPGYYIDVVQNPHRIKIDKVNCDSVKLEYSNNEPLLLYSTTFEYSVLKRIQNVNQREKPTKDSLLLIKNKNNPKIIGKIIKNHYQLKKINKLLESNKNNSIKGRKIAAWIIGVIAILLAILYVIFAIAAGGSPFVSAWIYLLGLPVAAAFLAIVALIVRFAGVGKEADYVYHPVGTGFINAGFYLSIIASCIAVIGFVFSFLINPFSFVGFLINIIIFLSSITAFSFGFRALKDDKTIKTKLMIILGFIALILAVVGMILIFI